MKRNFLLGKGERLAEDITVRGGGGPKEAPYTFFQARQRLTPMLQRASSQIDALPDAACPNEQAVVGLTLNPEYLSKSAYPLELLRAAGVTPVGSRPRRIKPERRSRNRAPSETLTTELFVMAPRATFRNWGALLPSLAENAPGAKDLASLEEIEAPGPEDKIKGKLPDAQEAVFEVVLHADSLIGDRFVLPYFQQYLTHLGVEADFGRRFYAGGLCFLEIEAPVDLADEIATFTVVRAMREMPRLRMLRPTIRAATLPGQALILPTAPAVDPSIRVAVFDGGVPAAHPLTQWVTPLEAHGIGPAHNEFLKHGVAVSSALLFGHLDPKVPPAIPYANIDHYRVLDTDPGQNPHELYDVLDRIDRVLADQPYEFVNLSLGPQLPIEDDDVHAWTAVLDDRLARTDTLAAIAVGNDGEGDALLGLNRIQVPADCVNALAVGACDTPDADWQRAAYSSVGPGRSPGLMKPDLVDFGGSLGRPFLVVGESLKPEFDATGGTSFAAPSVLRLGTGIKAHFGSGLNLLAIRTLLIHSTECADHSRQEVGWGRVPRDLATIVLCDDDTIRIVYQGTISPARYIRIPVPVPSGELTGNVSIKATLCYKTPTDPHHPGNYTRAGLELTFRPHDQKFSRDTQLHPDSKSFFGTTVSGMTEDELRKDAWKWENCLHATKSLRGSSLRNPTFDLHYNARLEGRDFRPDEPLSYAMIITVKARNTLDLYDQVVRKYATQLEPIRPVVDIPIQL